MNPDDLIARLTSAGLTNPDCLSMVRILAATEAAHVQQWSEIQRILTDAGIPMMSVVQRVKALADSLAPGLPEGWEWREGVYPCARQDHEGTIVQVERDRVWIADGYGGIEVPLSVVRAVLARAQGVGS